MTLPINVELVPGSAAGAVDTSLLKGAYVKEISLNEDTGRVTIVCQDADGNEVTVDNLKVEVIRPHTRYGAVSAVSTFAEADFTGSLGVSSMTSEITLPTYNVNAYVAFAVPANTPDLTDIITSADTQLNIFQKMATTLDIGGVAHTWYRTYVPQSRFYSGTTWTLVQ